MRQLAVVRQKQQPLRILIEPSDRKHADLAQLRREQVQHRSAPPILGRAQHARGLMQHDVGVSTEQQLLPVDQRPVEAMSLSSRSFAIPVLLCFYFHFCAHPIILCPVWE